MFIAYVVVAALLAALLALSAHGKLTRNEKQVTGLTGIGVPLSWFPLLATAELAGAAGLLVGIFYRPLGIAAAIGVVLYFVGAIAAHLRAKDTKGLSAPAPLLVFAAVALALGAASL